MPEHARELVTVGIAAYNAEDTLAKAVASALAQTWRPIEIIVVDDCSTDRTQELLHELQTAHEELRCLRLDRNSGVGQVRNRILAEARGEFVAFFDDDDVSDPERVARQVQRIRVYERQFASGAPVICHSARRVSYPDGSTRIEGTMGESESRSAPAGPAVAERILLGQPLVDGHGACPTCSQMARLSTYRGLGGFDGSLRRGEDTEFNVRLALAGGHFAGIARPLVSQLMTRSSDKRLEAEYEGFAAILLKHRNFVERAGSYEFCLSWLRCKFEWLAHRRGRFLAGVLALAMHHPVLTGRRALAALPNLALNRSFRRFHAGR